MKLRHRVRVRVCRPGGDQEAVLEAAHGTQGRSFLSHILLLDGNIVASGDQNMPGTAGNTNSCGRSSPNLLATSFDTTPKTFGESFTMFNKFAILIVDGLLESASIDCNPGARLGAAPSFLISFFVIE